jgi:RND family efflux transporter MFP subunit
MLTRPPIFRAAALIAATVATATTLSLAHADEPASVAVVVAPVVRKPIAQQVLAYGVVAGAAANVTTLSLPYASRVMRVLAQPGQSVARGAPLFIVQADASAVIALTQAQSEAKFARGELDRTEALFRDGLATQSQLAAARKALDDAREALAAQTRSGVTQGTNTIVAPAAGVVSQISAAQGDQVQAGTALAQLVPANAGADHAANVALGVEPADALTLRAGDRVVLHPLSASLGGTDAAGQIVLVGASIDTQTQFVNVGANVPLAGTHFMPGMHVRADIETHPGNWWNVPRAAVLQDSKGQYVFQVTPAGKAHRVAVHVEVERDNWYGVDGALDASRPLVVSGNYELEEGMAVRMAKGGAQ